ncbi:MAG: hypothetical protein K8S99_08475 [Planctomycetes bacterium]|nr:hypothetical protein [Planctomycetota bacterium]
MPYSTNCPQCHQPVLSDKQIEVSGKHYTLFRCPHCVERLGVGKQSAKRLLEFVVDAEGKVRRLSEVRAEGA